MNCLLSRRTFISMLSCVVLQVSSIPPAWCGWKNDASGKTEPALTQPNPELTPEEQWREKLRDVKIQRNLLIGAGVASGIGSMVLVVAGQSDINSARNSPVVCTGSRSTVSCSDTGDDKRN